MSRQTARLALEQLIGRPALVAPAYGATLDAAEITSGASLIADIRELAASDPAKEAARWQERKADLAGVYGWTEAQPSKPFAFADGRAIIPIHGVLINRFAYSWSFVTGYNFLRSQVAAAMADPDVTGIVFDVNSRGGMVAGCAETADAIYAASRRGRGKPSVAVVDHACFSAAYMLASQADRLVVTPTGEAGSIGVVLMHMDVSAALSDAGVKVTFIYAGAHKVDGNPYEPLSESVKAEFQADIDTIYDDFVATVVRGRAMSDAAVRGTEARCYLAADALTAGLIDAVQVPDDAVEAFFTGDPEDAEDVDPSDTDKDDPDMATAAPASPTPNADAELARTQAAAAAQAEAAAQQASATARTNERARISGITTHPEAAGREALASHLALQTDLSVDAAAGILAASPKAAPPAAEPAAPVAAAPTESAFKKAMDNGQHPNVGAGASNGTGEPDTQTPAQRILAAQLRTGSVSKPAARSNSTPQ